MTFEANIHDLLVQESVIKKKSMLKFIIAYLNKKHWLLMLFVCTSCDCAKNITSHDWM